MSHPPVIAILTDDARERARWAAALADGRAVMRTDVDDAAAMPEVVVFAPSQARVPQAAFPEAVVRGEIGLVAVGGAAQADVSLPSDCTQRELQLACRLLAEIVRLRRERLETRRRQTVLSQLAFTDPLTGVANRRAWDEQLRRKLAARQPFVLMLLDLDRFKRLNDELGHDAGDQCLRAVGQRLAAAVRQGDFVARLGGDEFGLLLSDVPMSSAAAIVDRIRLTACPAEEAAGAVPTASAGWAHGNGPSADESDAAALLRSADEALRAAKAAGRNCTRPNEGGLPGSGV